MYFGEHAIHQWFVLHLKSRQGKAVAAALDPMRIAYFLPLLRQVRCYGRRKLSVGLALFPSYVLLRDSREQALVVDPTRRIACILPVTDQDHLTWDPSNLRLALDRWAPLYPFSCLKEGPACRGHRRPAQGPRGHHPRLHPPRNASTSRWTSSAEP